MMMVTTMSTTSAIMMETTIDAQGDCRNRSRLAVQDYR
jgi:hypothetical protein